MNRVALGLWHKIAKSKIVVNKRWLRDLKCNPCAWEKTTKEYEIMWNFEIFFCLLKFKPSWELSDDQLQFKDSFKKWCSGSYPWTW